MSRSTLFWWTPIVGKDTAHDHVEDSVISQTAEYALRAIVYLAKMPDEAHITREIAEATRVPSGYLAKVMQTLVKADLVQSRRGLGGGFTLGRSPAGGGTNVACPLLCHVLYASALSSILA